MAQLDNEWRFRGACNGDPDPDRWYRIAEFNEQEPGQVHRLRAICATCPVVTQCLDHALRYEAYGVWAGTTPHERRQLRRETGITLAAVA